MDCRFSVLGWLTIIAAAGLLLLTGPAAAASKVPTRAGQQYLEVLQPDGTYKPIFVKGMNLSIAQPGKHPTGYPRDEALYLDWITKIADMNCNVVRVYTIHPPDFYNALYSHNKAHPEKAVWLIQGVWATAPVEYNYLADDYMAEIELNSRNAVNLIHGNADFDERPGWTGGRYKKDVSPWLLAWLVGREWEPDDIEGFHELRPDYTHYEGQNVSCLNGQPIECWFALICDYLVTYEDNNYQTQHPVTFSSWPPTDPLSHTSESNIEDESDVAGYIAEGRVEIFSNDAVNITSKNFTTTQNFKAGVYASYHVYPYWPDFIDNEPAYQDAQDRYGPSTYIGYLKDLKNFYNDRPLLIAEYGLPNGPMPCHLQSDGWHHGGLSEEQVAVDVPRLTEAIYDSGCAGGIVFAWIDEWFKKVWAWAEFYDPWDDRRLWYNLYDAEENYGMEALLPGADGPNCTLSGNLAEWAEVPPRTGECTHDAADGPCIKSVKLMHDEGFLHLAIELENFADWDFAEHGLYVGYDVLGDQRGNSAWPGPLKLGSDRGLEDVISITNGEARLWQTESFRFWESFRMPNSPMMRHGEVQPHILDEEDNRWLWFEPVLETNRRRVGRDGTVYEAQSWNLNPLPRGSLNGGAADSNDMAVWNISPDTGMIEIRMPWILLGFVGPHQMRVIQADPETEANSSEVSTGVGVAIVMANADGSITAAWPGLVDDVVTTSVAGRYAWDEWGEEDITFHSRLKPVYYSMQKLFEGLDVD
ncbi:hypothetical protein JW859_13795 [bacterium]|nr:hypothetical protein [bacterium]